MRISLETGDLPLAVLCCDLRGRIMAESEDARLIFARWPDLRDRLIADAVTHRSGRMVETEISRGRERLRLVSIPAAGGDLLRLFLMIPGAEVESLMRLDLSGLTAREMEVAAVAAEGRRSREIAELLGCTERTVRAHLQMVFRKTGVTSRTELAARWSGGRREG